MLCLCYFMKMFICCRFYSKHNHIDYIICAHFGLEIHVNEYIRFFLVFPRLIKPKMKIQNINKIKLKKNTYYILISIGRKNDFHEIRPILTYNSTNHVNSSLSIILYK